MFRRVAVVVAMGLSVAVLTGCPPTYPKCDSDEQCKSHNEVCVNGQCQECATDANCKAGFVCQANKCVPKPECTTDQNCPAGSTCTSGKCTPKSCTADADCPAGARCKNNFCVPNTCATNEDCGTGETCQGGMCAKAVAAPKDTCDFTPVYFGFDIYTLDDAARSQLNGLGDCMKKMDFTKITLEGNADPRGTEEYNLHLSERRATSVKKYLTALGINPKKLGTVGYGFNRPVNPGSPCNKGGSGWGPQCEAEWAKDRRVVFGR
jgi:peptidoglycan-associated lipoprotein